MALTPGVPAVADNVSSLGFEPDALGKDHGDVHFVEERNHVPIFEVVGAFDRGTPAETAAPRAAVAVEFFERYEDEYDALLVFSTFEFDTGEALAFHVGVRNDVLGIGQPLYDNSAAFGSDGVLASYVDMASVERYELNPVSRDYERVLNTAAHEILHRWCCQLLTEGADPTALLGRTQSHWNAGLDTDASVMYGSDWQPDGAGSYTAVSVRKIYSALDLYTAGFATAEEVSDLLLLESADLDPTSLPELGLTISATSRTVPMADIVSANGPRVPSAADSTKSFRAAVILIRRPGDIVEDELLAQLDTFRHQLSTRFAIHTGGRGRLDVVPAVIADDSPGAPGGVDAGTPGGGAASLAEGLIWLRSRQATDGSWQDVPATRWRDTSEALYTLGLLDPSFTGTQAAIDTLSAQVPANVDDQARSLRALSASGIDTTSRLPNLLGLRDADGGWGLGAGTGSSSLDTALTVQALSELLRLDPTQTQLSPLVDAAVQNLEASRGDGGWSPGVGGAGRVQPTAEALQALATAGVPAASLPDALAWVASQQNPDGGFGDSPSTPQATAQVLLALASLGAIDIVDRDAALAYLESQQTDEGSWRGSVYVTSLALRALRGARFANWRFDGPAQLSPATPRDGERVELTHRVENDGQLPTPPGVLALFDGDPAVGGVEVDRVALPAILPGGAVFATTVWDSLGQAGVHSLWAVLDPDEAEEEVSELDNRRPTEIEVLPAPVGADLEISADEVLVDPSRPAELPASLGFSAVVRNFGQSDAADVRVVLWRGDPSIGDPAAVLADEATVTVAARSSVPVNFVDLLTEPGEQLYTLQADADDAVTEDDETNNEAQVAVGTLAGLDLAVAAADLAVAGPTLLGRDVTLDAVVRNRGTIDSPSFTVRATVYTVADGPAGAVEVAAFDTVLAAGQSGTYSWTWRVDRLGDLVFAVELDPQGVVLETDESNNLASLDFATTADTGTNLSLSFEDLEFSPQPAQEGEPVELIARVRNTGAADLADVVAAFFDGDPGAAGVEIGRVTLPSLLAGGVGDARLTWSGWFGSADRTVHVLADPDDTLAETDESDNASFGVLEVVSRPNLAVSASSVRAVPAFPAPSEAVALEADIANLGEQDAGAFVVRFRLVGGGGGGAVLGDVAVAGLPAGQSIQVAWPWTAPSDPATVEVLVDAEDAVVEGSEADNQAEISLVPLSDEGVAPEFISPNGDGVQDVATFFHGELPGQTLDLAIYAESDGRLVRSDVSSGGAYVWDGRGSQGALQGTTVPDGAYRLVASSGGVPVAEGRVTVDNDRSPLFDAEGTSFARLRNLTCDAPEVVNHKLADGDTLSYYVDPATQSVLYRRPLGGAAEQLHRSAGFDKYDLSDDGLWRVRGWPVVLERADGSGTQPVDSVRDFGFLPGSHDLAVYHSNGQLWIYPAGNPAAARYVATPGQWVPLVVHYDEAWSDPRYQSFSPDGRLLVAYDANFSTADDLALIDLETGAQTDLMQSHPELDDLWVNAHVWSPDGSRLAVIFEGETVVASTENTQLVVAIFDRDGNRLAYEVYRRTFFGDTPDGAAAGVSAPGGGATMYYWEHSIPVFDATGDRLFFSTVTEDVASYRAYHGALLEFDIAAGEFRRLVELAPVVYVPFVYHGVADGEHLPLFHQLAPELTASGDLFVSAEFDLDINDVDLYSPGNWLVDTDGAAPKQVLEEFDFFFDPRFDSGARRFLFRDNRDTEDPESECHRPGLEIPPYNSIAIYSSKSVEGENPPRFEAGVPTAPSAAERRARSRRRAADGAGNDSARAGVAAKGFGPSDYRHQTSYFLFDSLANLTAELEAAPAAGGVGWILSGTVSDLHLADWQLDWQDEALPGFWQPLASGTSAVADATLAVWSPPHAGSFRVRLVAHDRAGNRRSTQRLLSAGDDNLPAVAAAYAEPRQFSPNGDGLADSTVLRYEVSSPVNLQIHITDSAGRQVFTASRSHTAAGPYELVWDGRDQTGVPVPSGSYQFEVLHFRLAVVVDLEAPDVSLQLLDPLRDAGETFAFATELRWCADDADPGVVEDGEIETGPAPSPASWTAFRTLGPLDACPAADRPLTTEEFVDQAFRLTARDRARNSARVVAAAGPERLVAHGFGTDSGNLLLIPTATPLAAPSGVRNILLGETIRQPIAAVSVQLQIEGQSSWREDPVDAVLTATGGPAGAIPDHGFQVVWSGPVPAGIHRVRVRAVAASGGEYLSNVFRIEGAGTDGGGLRLFRHPEPDDLVGDAGSDLRQALVAAGLDPERVVADDDPAIWWTEALTEVTGVALFVDSEDDARFAGGRLVQPKGQFGSVHVFDLGSLKPCRSYFGMAGGQELPSGRAVQSNAVSGVEPCMELELDVAASSGEGCSSVADTTATLSLLTRSVDGEPLLTADIALDDPDDVIWNVNLPIDGQSYSTTLDLLTLGEGRHTLYARLVNLAGEVRRTVAELPVDFQAPQVRWLVPGDGALVCGSGSGEMQLSGEDEGLGFQWSATLQPADGAGVVVADGSETAPTSSSDLVTLVFSHTTDSVLAGRHGSFLARVTALDDAGNGACEEISFVVDSRVDGQLTAQPTLVSPNGDGILDRSEILLTVGEATVADLAVYAAVLQTVDGVQRWLPTGSVLRTLAAGVPVSGSAQWSWDGRLAGGAVAGDGTYAVVADLTDGCGNSTSRLALVDVDSTPPVAVIALPTAGAVLDQVTLDVVGSISDLHLNSWRLEVGAGASPTVFAPIVTGSQTRVNEVLATWNASGLEGVFTLRLRADDEAGLFAEAMRTVELTGGAGLVSSLEADPPIFAPGGNAGDRTAIRSSLLAGATVDLDIIDSGGGVVRTLVVGQARTLGTSLDVWNGRDDGGALVADGEYRARLRAASGPAVQTESVSVTTDRTPPLLSLSQPVGSFVAPDMAVVGSILDAHLASYRVDLQVNGVWQVLSSGSSPQTDAVLGNLSLAGVDLGGSPVILRLVAADEAGNSSELTRELLVDSAAPDVELLAPTAGALVSSAAGAVEIFAQVIEDHGGGSWRLEAGAGPSPSGYSTVASGRGLPAAVPQALAAWNTSALADGLWTLRLTVTDGAGQSGSDSVTVTVDETAPVVSVTQPAVGGFVTGPTDVLGTATDDHLERYEVLVAPRTGGAFSRIAVRTTPVTSGLLLDWRALPPDGDYTLRVVATDLAGRQTLVDVPVTVDTRPPSRPDGLEVTVPVGAPHADLSWNAVPDADLDGYKVLRDGLPVGSLIALGTTYRDLLPPEGVRTYSVIAVDRAALESAPSDAEEVLIDRSPPAVRIQRPQSGGRVADVVDVFGTANAADDFGEWRLFAGLDGATPSLVRRSTVGTVSDLLAAWDATLGGVAGDGDLLRLRLEAEDVRGNEAVHEVTVTLDQSPPGRPTGLAAAAAGSDVTLTWDANAEPDLAGYLLYRDGRSLFGDADHPADAARNLTSWLDALVPDGDHTYVLVAVDLAGLLSLPSDPADVSLDERAPHAVFVRPEDGDKTDGTTDVLLSLADTDLDTVDVEFRADGAAVWSPVSSLSAAPWQTTWDPGALAYGIYHLRAVATDLGGRTDPAPDEVSISYQDLQPPPAVATPTAAVDGDQVTLGWAAVSAADLAGYHVERRQDDSGAGGDAEFVRLTAGPTSAAAYVDTGVPDGRHAYRIVAVDTWDNEASPSPETTATVYVPVFDPVLSPTSVFTTSATGSAVSVDGPVSGQVQAEVEGPSGITPLPSITTAADGTFSLAGVPLEPGTNTLRASVVDGDGHRSRTAEAQILAGNEPSPPTGLSPTVTGNRVDLTWNANPEPDILGYFVYVDGVLDTDPAQLPWSLMTAAASSAETFYPASDALRTSSYWAPVVNSSTPVAGQWWQTTWTDPALVTGVFVEWWSYWYRAIDYDVLVTLDGIRWQLALEVRGNDESDIDHDFPQTLPIRGVRLLIHTMDSPPTDSRPLRLDTFRVNLLSPQPNLDWADPFLSDGLHTIGVSAVSELGFESPPSEVQVAVGDVEPPTPVTLTAVAAGSDVQLTWTPSPSPDVLFHQIFRDGEGIGAVAAAATTFDDVGVANGTHVYLVKTFDGVGNAADSNEVSVVVDVPPPPAPVALTLDVPAEGGALDLGWTAPAQPVAGYRVFRSDQSGGPWQELADLNASTLSFRDASVVDGVRYFYVARSLDTLGNESPVSNEVSGVPEDTLAPETSIFVPTVPGRVHLTDSTLLDRLAGLSAPGAEVEIYRDGELVSNTTAEPGGGGVHWAAGANSVGAPYLSPSGRWLWITYWSTWNDQQVLYDFSTDTLRFVSGINWPSHWMPDGESLVFSTNDWPNSTLSFYRPVDGSTTASGAELQWIDAVAPSPDGRFLAVLGDRDDVSGFHLYDLESGIWTTPLELPTWQVAEESLTWTADGRYLTYLQRGDVMALDPATGIAEVLSDTAPTWGRALDPSPDGRSVAYIAAANGDRHVFVHDFGLGTSRQVTLGSGVDYERARYTADGSALAVLTGDGRLVRIGLSGEEEAVLYEYQDWWYDLDAAGGYLLVTDDGDYGRLVEAGRFEVRNIPLRLGDNLFTARGTDDAGNVGLFSEPITVRLEASSLPDLRITADDLSVLPTFPITGQAARVTVTVRNVGGVAADPSELRWELVDEDGGTVVGGPVATPSLGAGEALDVTVDLSLAAGRYILGATADAGQLVSESDEANNHGEISLVALADAGPAIYVDTDRPTYGPDDDVRIGLELVNGGPTVEGDVWVRIEDAAGFLVEDLGAVGEVSLDLGERATLQVAWSTGDVFAGDYRVVAELRTPEGAALAAAASEFAISDDAVVELSSSTAAGSYVSGTDVTLNVVAGYLAGNSVLRDSVLRWAVGPAGGADLATGESPLADLLPGDAIAVPVVWSSAGAPAGSYEFEITWLAADGSVLATDTAPFALSGQATGLEGSLELSLGQPPVGVDQVITYEVESLGGAGRPAQPIRVRTSHSNQGLVDELVTTVDLSVPGFGAEGSHVLATGGLTLATYAVRLEAEVDVEGTPTWVLLASGSFETADGTPPLLGIAHPQPDGYLGLGQKLAATAVDALSSVARVDLSVDGSAWLPAALADPSAGLWTRGPGAMAEGAHVLNARAQDAWGNVAQAGPVSFVADFTPPEILITGVEEGGAYDAPVVPVITIVEVHPGSEQIRLNGLPFISGTTVGEEASYYLSVEAVDAAENRTYEDLRFVIGSPDLPLLRAEKTVSLSVDADASSSVTPGDALVYELTLFNEGPGDATNLLLEDALSASLALVPGSVTTTAGSVTGTDPITVELALLGSGQTAVVSFQAVIDPAFPAPGTIGNQGSVASVEQSPTASDDPALPGTSDVTVVVVEAPPTPTEPELVFTKTGGLAVDVDGDGLAHPGDVVEYELVLTNVGDGEATDVVLDDATPDGATYVADSLVTGVGVTVLGVDPLALALDVLAPSASTTVTFRVRLDPLPGDSPIEIANQAQVESAETLPQLSDDPSQPGAADPTTTTVHPTPVPTAPELTLSKTADLVVDVDGDGLAHPGDVLEYELVLANVGDGEATDLLLNDTTPDGATYVADSLTTGAGVTVLGVDPLALSLDVLAPSASTTITFRVRLDPLPGKTPIEIANQAQVESAETLPQPSDDPSQPGTADPTTTTVYPTPVPTAPLLTLSKTDDLAVDVAGDGVAHPGDVLEYELVLTNVGDGEATDLLLNDTTPDGATYVADSLVTGAGVAVLSVDPLVLSMDVLAPTASTTVTFQVSLDPLPGKTPIEIANQAQVESAETLPQPSDDPSQPGTADPTTTTVYPASVPTAPALTLRKIDYLAVDVAGDGVAHPGDVLEYELVLTNVGNGAATDLRLDDATPNGTTYVFGSLVVDSGVTVVDQDPLVVTLESLGPGESTTVLFRVEIDEFDGAAAIEIANQAEAESAETPPQASDDPSIPGSTDPTVTIVSPALPADPMEIPTLGLLGRVLFGLLLLGLGFRGSGVRRSLGRKGASQ